MEKLQLSSSLITLDFDYELEGGEVLSLTYKQPSTAQDRALQTALATDTAMLFDAVQELLYKNVYGKGVEKFQEYIMENDDIFALKGSLDAALGKLKASE